MYLHVSRREIKGAKGKRKTNRGRQTKLVFSCSTCNAADRNVADSPLALQKYTILYIYTKSVSRFENFSHIFPTMNRVCRTNDYD